MTKGTSGIFEGVTHHQEQLREQFWWLSPSIPEEPRNRKKVEKVDSIDLASIQEDFTKEVEYLQGDEYFKKFLHAFNRSIPSIEGLSGEKAFFKLKMWARSLEKPMRSYINKQLARSLGVEILELKKVIAAPSPLPDLEDFASLQEACNAYNALQLFRDKILRIEEKVEDELCTAFARQSLSPSSKDEDTFGQPPKKSLRANSQSCISRAPEPCQRETETETRKDFKKARLHQLVGTPSCPDPKRPCSIDALMYVKQEPSPKRIKTS